MNNLKENAKMMVLLHSCSQGARDYATNAGWVKYAEEWGILLLTPEQSSKNNYLKCFSVTID